MTPKDIIMKQEPEAFTYLEPGSRVNIIISKGEEIKMVIMPKVTGDNIIEGKNELLALDLEIGEVTPEPNNEVPKDHIIWQSYEPGTELETKTAVDLYVSTGPEVEEPIEEPEEEPDNKDKDKETPFKISIIPFTDRAETQVVIIRKQDGVSEEVYKRKHKAEEGEVSINVKGKIGAEFEVLFDDIYQFTRIKEE